MRGFQSSSFDPQTLVILETAFDEAWLTLKAVGNTTVRPDELARSVLRSSPRFGARSSLARGRLKRRGQALGAAADSALLESSYWRGPAIAKRSLSRLARADRSHPVARTHRPRAAQ
jgi:hypothetical protein